ncbi:hypothetical protein B0H13DRAFT_876739 [Mycena leptocephala]|nr:hypothetical protein B0H13DRAFT_876739 [Mycena leptocephala]
MSDDIRVDDLWFSNDTLVIRADKRIFRVSRSILAVRSSVFADMVAFPQPAGNLTEEIEGSPVVTLSDSALEVEVFLRAIFDSSYFMPPPSPVELNAVLGVLRLAHKYDVQYLYLRALQHLSVGYGPSSVEEYRTPKAKDHIIYDSDKHLRFFSIIRAVTEVGALWLLPIPYYLAAKYSRATLRSKIPVGAEEQAVQRCLAAQVELLRGTGKLQRPFSTLSHCSESEKCNTTKDTTVSHYFQSLWHPGSLSPLETWSCSAWDWMSNHLCNHCLAQAKTHHATILQEVWDDLPEMFDLPSWEELKTMRTAVMGDTD